MPSLLRRLGLVRGANGRSRSEESGPATASPSVQVLVEPSDVRASVDIVAVHGLARGFDSWTWGDKPGSFWLREPFARHVPNARIITFSYDPEALSLQFLVRKILYGRALDLVDGLRDLRRRTGTTKRPLVFVAHSLGGLIVKRAIILASEAEDRSLRDIELSTGGIVFFGCPGDVSPEDLELIIRKVAHLSPSFRALERADDELVRTDTRWFEKEMEAFKPLTARINILSCSELRPTSFSTSTLRGGRLEPVVSEDLVMKPSISGVPHEAAPILRLKKRHTGLVRWGHDDEEYPKFLESLQEKILDPVFDVVEEKWQKYDKVMQLLNGKCNCPFLREDFSLPSMIPHGPEMVAKPELLSLLAEYFDGDGENSGHGDNHIKIVALYGNMGAGKTTLARHYSLQAAQKGRTVIWINAESRETAVTGYLELAKAMIDFYWEKYASKMPATATDAPLSKPLLRVSLGLPDVEKMLLECDVKQLEPIKVQMVVRAVKNWLFQKDNFWLLVFDNVNSSWNLLEFLPITLHGNIILATRDAGRIAWATCELEVPDWTEHEASLILTQLAGQDINDPATVSYAEKIVRLLSNSPLSISSAAMQIREGLSMEQYCNNISIDLTLSFDSYDYFKDLPGNILAVSSMLSPQAIPVELFTFSMGSVSTALTNYATTTSCPRRRNSSFGDQTIVHKALDSLLDANVVQKVDPDSLVSRGDIQPHPSFLLYKTARECVKKRLNDGRHATLKLMTAKSACTLVVQLIKWHERNATGAASEARKTTMVLPWVQSFGRLMLPHARECFKLSAILDKSSLDGVQWQVLGNLLMTQGANGEAIGCFELALQGQSMTDAVDKTQTTLFLAMLYNSAKRTADSRRLLDSIKIDSAIKARDPALEFSMQLARAAEWAAEGNLEDAEDIYQKLEKEHTHTPKPRVHMRLGPHPANNTHNNNNNDNSRGLSRGDDDDNNSPISYKVVLAVHRLAATMKALGKLEEAQALYRRALTSYKVLLGEECPLTLEVAEELGQLQQLRGAFSSAGELYELAIRTKRAALGDEHPSTAASEARLATLRDLQGRFADADRQYEHALRVMRARLGPAHRSTLATLEDRALSYRMRTWRPESPGGGGGGDSDADGPVGKGGRGDDFAGQRKALLEKAMETYRLVIKLKKENRHLYTQEDIEATKARRAEMAEAEGLVPDERDEEAEAGDEETDNLPAAPDDGLDQAVDMITSNTTVLAGTSQEPQTRRAGPRRVPPLRADQTDPQEYLKIAALPSSGRTRSRRPRSAGAASSDMPADSADSLLRRPVQGARESIHPRGLKWRWTKTDRKEVGAESSRV